MEKRPIRHYKLKALPTIPIPDAVLYIYDNATGKVKTYITDIVGTPIPLIDLSGIGGIQTITNTDGYIEVTGVNNVILNLNADLVNLINSAIQPGDNISDLVNDAGYVNLQNNTWREVFLGFYSNPTGFISLFNQELVVSETENVMLIVAEEGLVGEQIVFERYKFARGKGTWQPIPRVVGVDIIFESTTIPSSQDIITILQGANTQTFELGDITNNIYGGFVGYINNTGPYDTTDTSNEYLFLFTDDGVTYLYLFKGDNLIYGAGQAISDISQYTLVTSSAVPVSSIPSWQQTINVDKNSNRARLYHDVFEKNYFGGFSGAGPTIVIQDPNTDRIYVYGYFVTYGGITKNYIIALNPDGTVDESYVTGLGFNNFAYQTTRVLLQADGKIIYTGSFTNYNGNARNRLVRINTDGSIDNTFNVGTGFNNYTLQAREDSLGRIYVTGEFGTYNGETGRGRIVRLNPDGTRDTSFISGTGFNQVTISALPDSSNNVYITGYFSQYKGVAVSPRIVKLLENGNVDPSFNAGTGFNSGNSQPLEIHHTSDNKLMVVGYFTLYNGTPVNKVVKLNLDGTIDTSFQSQGTGFNGTHITEFFEYNGNYVFSGFFTSYNGTPSNNTIILSPTGEIVRTFSEYTYAYGVLNSGEIIARSNDSSVNFLGILQDNYIVNIKELDYSEVDGKARYKVGGLSTIEDEEIMPRRLIEELIQDNAPSPFNPSNYDLEDFNNVGSDPFVRESEIPVPTVPNLQQVTEVGNTTTTPIQVAELQIYDEADGGYAKVIINDGYYTFFDSVGNIIFIVSRDGNFAIGNQSTGFLSTISNEFLTTNRVYYLADEDGDIPLLNIKTVNFTATLGVKHHTNGTLTVTDPTPEANKGYIVYVIGGTTTINGVRYTAGNLVYRFYNGTTSTWVSQLINSSLGFTPENVANKATNLTSPDNTKYPTTQAVVNELNLYQKFLISKPVGVYGTVTGTTAETVILSIPFLGGEFEIGDYLSFDIWTKKVGVAATTLITVRAGTTGTTADSVLSLLSGHIGGQSSAASRRDGIIFETGNFINGRTRQIVNATAIDVGSFVTPTRFSLDPSNPWFLTFTVTHTNAADEISVTTYSVSKRKSF